MTNPIHSPTYASEEKIKRAKGKFDYLKSGINRYIQSHPHSVRVERHADHRYVITCLDKSLPDEFAWEVVEAVGHLRGALDKIIVELVELNGHGTSGVGFPFGGIDRNTGKPDTFPNKGIEKGAKKKLTSDQWRIIEAQRPYPGGNDVLWAVNEIANADKHRKGLVTIRPTLRDEHSIGAGPGGGYYRSLRVNPTDCDFVLKDKERERVLLAVQDGGFNQRINTNISESIVFGRLMPVQGKNVLVTLNQQIRMVESIIKVCKRFFK